MTSSPTGPMQYLQQVPYPHGRQGQRHSHTSMLAVTTSAMLCNSQSYEAVAQGIRPLPIEVWNALGACGDHRVRTRFVI
ncbi:MAG: transposase family protein [Fuerstiella sp.]|nr:transposase family protein [Fuerstiella sp.]MCP4856730.1 transposase family protein [Fuerstiella sp.]